MILAVLSCPAIAPCQGIPVLSPSLPACAARWSENKKEAANKQESGSGFTFRGWLRVGLAKTSQADRVICANNNLGEKNSGVFMESGPNNASIQL